MRKILQRRLAHLERRAAINKDSVWVSVNLFGPNKVEPDCAEADERVWHREPCETLEDFASRVEAEARNHNRDHLEPLIVFFSKPEEVTPTSDTDRW